MVLRPCGKGQKCFGLGHMKRGCEGNWVHSAAFFWERRNIPWSGEVEKGRYLTGLEGMKVHIS